MRSAEVKRGRPGAGLQPVDEDVEQPGGPGSGAEASRGQAYWDSLARRASAMSLVWAISSSRRPASSR
jgi:hypothetical protein